MTAGGCGVGRLVDTDLVLRSYEDTEREVAAICGNNPDLAPLVERLRAFFVSAKALLAVVDVQDARIAELERELAAARGERPQ